MYSLFKWLLLFFFVFIVVVVVVVGVVVNVDDDLCETKLDESKCCGFENKTKRKFRTQNIYVRKNIFIPIG